GPSGSKFFNLLSNPPSTPYPNDGWVVAGNKGPFWKIKPDQCLTLDVMYTVDSGWQLAPPTRNTLPTYYSPVDTDQVITEFPHPPVPKNLPHETISKIIGKMFDEDNLEMILELLALNLDYIKQDQNWYNVGRVLDKLTEIGDGDASLAKFHWMLKGPIVRPKDWVEQYQGEPIYDGVWRCEWDNEQEKWRPLCRRFDKTTANTVAIAKQLTEQHQHRWNPAVLAKYENQRPYYNLRGPKTKDIRTRCKKQRDDIAEFCNEHNLHTNLFVNLGCGYHKQKRYRNSLDIDPYVVAEQNWIHGSTILWADASNLTNPATGQQYTLGGTNVAVQKAIHYFAKTRESWLNFMSTISAADSLFVTMIDADDVFAKSDMYTFPDASTMKRGRQSWHRGVWEGTTQLQWTGGNVIQEPLISYSFLKEELRAAGWKEKDTRMTELGVRIMYWTK
ncbi:hypothetical protein LCGC14_1839870, partial [marine sediment metagenome]